VSDHIIIIIIVVVVVVVIIIIIIEAAAAMMVMKTVYLPVNFVFILTVERKCAKRNFLSVSEARSHNSNGN
jgi:hypothetical protein